MITIDGKVYFARAEQHQYQNEITQYPVEKGGKVADHVIAQPTVLNVESIVSDTPLIAPTGQTTGLPSDEALAHLRLINANRNPVTIITDLGKYENMVCQSLTMPRDGETGKALRFTAVFQQVLLITNERTTIEVATPIAANKKNLGHKSSPESVEDPTTGEPPRVITYSGKSVTLDPKTYFAKSQTDPGKIARAGRIPTAVGGS